MKAFLSLRLDCPQSAQELPIVTCSGWACPFFDLQEVLWGSVKKA